MLKVQKNAPLAHRISIAKSLIPVAAAAFLATISTPVAAYVIFPGVPASSVRTVNVSTPAELSAAIAAATGPTDILLAGGNYGEVSIKGINKPFDIVVRSASLTNRAVIAELVVYNTSRFRFEALDFSHTLKAGEGLTTPGVFTSLTDRIAFTSCNFHGTKDGNANNDGMMLFLTKSTKSFVFNNDFRQSRMSLGAMAITNLFILRNNFTETREGINLDGVTYGYLERNFFTKVAPNLAAGDHADAIQVYVGSSGLTTNGLNILANAMILNSAQAQGILIQRGNPRIPYNHSAIVIRENIYYGGMRQGIWVEDSNSLLIERNTLIGATGFSFQPAVYIKNVVSSTVKWNIAHFFLYVAPVVPIASNNIDLADAVYPTGPSAQSQFVGTVSGVDPAVTNFRVLPGSAAAVAGAGAFVYGDIGRVAGTTAAVEAKFQTEWARLLAR